MQKKFLTLILTLLLLTSCGELTSSNGDSTSSAGKISCGVDQTVDGYHFVLPDLGEDVEIHTEMQKAYLETTSKNYGTVSKYADGLSEASYQKPVKLTWEVEGGSVNSYVVKLSTNNDLSNCLTYETDLKELEVDNLMIGTVYYWNVTVNDTVSSGIAKFVTSSVAPRNLRIPGVKNVRDMGGISTISGKKIKQNRIIRCGALTLNETGSALITSEGIDILNNQFHLKTELDLRGETSSESGNLKGSILGDQVSYKLFGLKYNVSDCLVGNQDKLNDIFSLFANEENYPICFHCSEGTDRAGMIAFLLNALLGVSEIDNYKDYLFSAFRFCSGKIPQLSAITGTYVKTIKGFKGDNFSQQTYNALVHFGVDRAILDNIIALNLE